MISILVPTLNEADNIPLLINDLKKINFEFELIIVDDNSTDNTSEVIEKYLNEKIRFIKRVSKDRDLSKSIILGAKESKFDNILVLDCDLQHEISNSNIMYDKLIKEKKDVVIGSRFFQRKYSGNLGFLRSFFSLLFIAIINICLNKKSSDPLSGFFMCKKNLLLEYEDFFYLNGYKILFDIIYNGKKNLNIEDIQIKFKKRVHGKSKLNLKIVFIFVKHFFYTFRLKSKK